MTWLGIQDYNLNNSIKEVIFLPRTPQDPQVRIDEILDTAEPLFAVNGYRKTTISDIAKKMGVAQGMFYYYFKSKEEILEALINRQISVLLADIKRMVYSETVTPSCKIELIVRAIFQTAQYKNGLFLDFLYDEKNLQVKNKVLHQGTMFLKPWLLRIIEEGISKHFFHVSQTQTALNFIVSILLCLCDALCEKLPDEIISSHLRMAESLIEKTLGMQENTIHIGLEKNE